MKIDDLFDPLSERGWGCLAERSVFGFSVRNRTLCGHHRQVMQSLIGLYPYKVWHFTP